MNIFKSLIASFGIYPWYRQWRRMKYAEKNTKRCLNMASGELDFHQLNNGPIFGDDTKEILNEVFGNNNKNKT